MSAACRTFFLLTSAFFVLAGCVTPPVTGQQQAQQPQEEHPIVENTPAQQPKAQEFVATEELKKKTFDEVQAVIEALDRIIAVGDYDQWLSFLTEEYVASRSSADFLKEASGAAVLKKNGIVLHSLQDYFTNVVVRSRLQATLADINFVDADHVKAFTRVQGTLYILYYLVREDGRWKIGVLPTGEP